MYNKDDFELLARLNISRDGIEDLLSVLTKGDFYTAPASTKYHDNVNGGLVHHSVKVYHALKKLLADNGINQYTEENIAIVSLFHDLCKMGFYTVSTRNVKGSDGKWTQEPYYSVEDKFPVGHGEKSLIMLLSLMKLSTSEILAIRWHMGGFNSAENYSSISKAYEECPLALYLHMADLQATYQK